MSSIFLSTHVSIELFLEFFLLLVLSYTVIQVVFILKGYKKEDIADVEAFVEKKSYLVSLLVQASLVVKIFLVAFFTFALDGLSSIVPGAMCVTGVLNTNSYGEYLFPLKLSILLLSSLWLILNKADLESKDGVFFQRKMFFFLLLYGLIIIELIVSIAFFSSIDTALPVSCCSAKSIQESILPFGISTNFLVALFYALYIVVMLSAFQKKKLLLFLSTSAFVVVSFYTIVYFFGTYIYDAWSHHCPYCMLQHEYYYIGYLIYISMFLFVFYSLGVVFFQHMKYAFKNVIMWLNIFVFLLSINLII